MSSVNARTPAVAAPPVDARSSIPVFLEDVRPPVLALEAKPRAYVPQFTLERVNWVVRHSAQVHLLAIADVVDVGVGRRTARRRGAATAEKRLCMAALFSYLESPGLKREDLFVSSSYVEQQSAAVLEGRRNGTMATRISEKIHEPRACLATSMFDAPTTAWGLEIAPAPLGSRGAVFFRHSVRCYGHPMDI